MSREKPYTVTAGNGFLDLRISGDAYKNLVKMAEALNSVENLDSDNTAETVAESFIFGWTAWRLATTEDALEEAYTIADGIDTGTDDEAESEKRKSDLRHAFNRAFTPSEES